MKIRLNVNKWGYPDKNRATASNSNCFVLFRYLTLADMFPQDTAKHICGSCAYNLNCCKCQRTSRFLSRSLISLTSRLPSQHALRRLNCSLFYSLVCENMSNVSSVCGNISMDYSFSIVCFWYS